MKRVLLCGSNGLLGQQLALSLSVRADLEVLNTGRQRSFVFDHHLFDYTQLDLTQRGDVRSLISSFQPDVVINTVAAVDVDWCELHHEQAWQGNVATAEHLAEACRKTGAHLIHYSTDYVFDGRQGPYDESARPGPVNYYGKTKLAAENALLAAGVRTAILRVSLLFGSGTGVKGNFGLKTVRMLREGTIVRATNDIGTNPTHIADAADAAVACLERGTTGLYHVSGATFATRYEFARTLANVFGYDPALVQLVNAGDLRLPAARPPSTGFRLDKAGRELDYRPMTLDHACRRFKDELFHLSTN
ncbi:MAG: SDR family oxidoreductase [Bacteroidetes bacterium]|jgi:dTDP-4-dehydrorhamnose reductase|nr:SDR family oxidoreductase [Bacteroidota bacterium]